MTDVTVQDQRSVVDTTLVSGLARRVPEEMGEQFDQILTAAQAGAGWAAERLWTSLSPAVAGYLRVQGAPEPDDQTSEVFIGVFRSLSSFSGTEEQFRSWVFTIAHRRLVDERRRAGRRPPLSLLDFADGDGSVGHSAEHEAVERLGSEQVRRLCERPVPDQRDVLLLQLMGGLTVDEVAAASASRRGPSRRSSGAPWERSARLLTSRAYPFEARPTITTPRCSDGTTSTTQPSSRSSPAMGPGKNWLRWLRSPMSCALWRAGRCPPPRQLTAMLADGFSTEKTVLLATAASNVPGPAQQAAGLPKWRKKRMIISSLLAGLSVPAKALVGISMAAASVGGAAAAGVPVAQDAVSAVTPVNFGQEVSTDARDGGVDGQEISERAKARAEERRQDAERGQDAEHRQDGDQRSGAPEAPGSTGLDQANTTPGADHAPDSVPATPAAGADNKPVDTPAGPPAETPATAPVSTPAGPPTSTPAGPPAGVPVGRP